MAPPSPPPPSGERLERSETLRRTEHYRRCYATGRRKSGSLLLLYSFPNEVGSPRLGLTASAKVGGAVERHRLKRRVRELYRRWPLRAALPAVDLVVHFKPGAARSTFAELKGEVERLFSSLLPRATQ